MLATFQNKGSRKKDSSFLMRWKASTPAAKSFCFEKKRVPEIGILVGSTKKVLKQSKMKPSSGSPST